MCVLPDWMIEQSTRQKLIVIDPFEPANLSAASYDFRLGDKFLRVTSDTDHVAVPTDELAKVIAGTGVEQSYIDVHPGECVLGLSKETFGLGDTVAAIVFSKSTYGRLFINVACGDAGWWDPGFGGRAVLEIVNHGPHYVRLLANQRIGQVVFQHLTAPCAKPYRGHYQDQGDDLALDQWKASLTKLAKEARGEPAGDDE